MLLRSQAHVYCDNNERAWSVGHNQLPPYVRISLKLDEEAYGIFHHTASKPRSHPMVDTERPVEAFFFTSTDSAIDLITTDTLARMGIQENSLLEVSTEGRELFREANMSLKGAFFTNLRSIDPIAQIPMYTNSLVNVADGENNHLSQQTIHNLELRKNTSLGDMLPLYFPRDI